MAEEYQLSFTLPQVKALRALEECGVGSGSPRSEIEHFRSTQLVTAANAAYEALKAKRQSIKREHNTCPLMLALFKRPARLWRVGRFFLLVSLYEAICSAVLWRQPQTDRAVPRYKRGFAGWIVDRPQSFVPG